MTIAEIRKLEEDREGKLNIVHLQKEGSFYHANDWSAYLMTKYPIGEALNKPMAVTAKKLKDGYIHAFVGFPATSIGKYVPNDGSISFTPVSDTQIDVTLNLTSVKPPLSRCARWWTSGRSRCHWPRTGSSTVTTTTSRRKPLASPRFPTSSVASSPSRWRIFRPSRRMTSYENCGEMWLRYSDY